MPISRIEKREFKLGVRTLPDLNPSLPPEESLQLHAQDYPEIVNSKLEGPQIIDGVQVYTVKASLGYKG
jgi:PRTRC genetic system protein C